MKEQNKMGIMPIPKLVISMSLPIMISMLVQSLYNIVDSIFVSRISESALTATSIAYSAQMLQIAVAVGTGVGMNAVVSRFLGAGNQKKADEAATTGLVLTVWSSLIFVLWGIFATRPFVELFAEDEEIIEYAVTYLRICQIWATGLFLGTFTQRLLQATGRTLSSMFAQLAGAVVNIILDPLLIFGIGILPEMGIAGAAIATVIGQWSSALAGILLNYIQNKEIHFAFRGYRMDKDTVKLIYKVGAPTILMQALGSIMVGVMNMILVIYSTTAVAFFGVYFKLQSFLFMPMNGLGQGALPIVGYNYGSKKWKRIKQTLRTSLLCGIILGVLGLICFCLFTEPLLLLFNASEDMLSFGVTALRIIALTFPLASATMIIGYVISGLGNGMVNMLSTAIRQVIVLLPCTCFLGKIFGFGGIWYAFWIAETIAFLFAVYSVRKKFTQLVMGNEK